MTEFTQHKEHLCLPRAKDVDFLVFFCRRRRSSSSLALTTAMPDVKCVAHLCNECVHSEWDGNLISPSNVCDEVELSLYTCIDSGTGAQGHWGAMLGCRLCVVSAAAPLVQHFATDSPRIRCTAKAKKTWQHSGSRPPTAARVSTLALACTCLYTHPHGCRSGQRHAND